MTGTWNLAVEHMRAALKILDDTGAPEDVGAYLDLAILRIEAAIASGSMPDPSLQEEMSPISGREDRKVVGKLAK